MAQLDLTRTPGDRRLYALEGVGTLRWHGWASRRATAHTAERTWEITRSGLWRPAIRATDAAGTVVGEFTPPGVRSELRWEEDHLVLRPARLWRDRYALAEGDRELAVLEARGWGPRPVRITVGDPDGLPPGLLLFAAFVVRSLAQDTASAAAGSASGGS